ncbi:GAP family protein [Mycolicibacterium fluoranthenivorans]|uniref:Sap, sulfolipid-1-addressing protein n=1 Tax=Mycolicibacterium fluoranthenivorans TaxID=258505 RepID=A0A1G4WWC9_9MYCO|nr:GAP family protein [Mycolicibacterium fluoranthenivorans]SCX30432.1 Sap, sulfolipid-1-addressing protein [Mycolicibacterium fluoranthenivorans]
MWLTLLVMAIAVSLEPFRIGMSVVMLSRPRPRLQLAAFLAGGFAMGMAVGVTVLFIVGEHLPETQFTLPRVQIGIGVVALFAALGLALTRGKARTRPNWMSRVFGGQSLWVAGAAGLGIALPSLDYLAALAVIAASGGDASTQLTALIAFNVVAFALVEIPLIAYMVAPARTSATMTALNDWIKARRRWEVAALLACVGGVLLIAGLLGI